MKHDETKGAVAVPGNSGCRRLAIVRSASVVCSQPAARIIPALHQGGESDV